MKMLSSKQITELAKQSTTQAQIKELYEYALGKERFLTDKGKHRRAAMWRKACITMRGIELQTIASAKTSKPKPTITKTTKQPKRQKNTGILMANLEGLSTKTKSYLARSQGCSKPSKTQKDLADLAKAYKQWKQSGTMPDYCMSPIA